MSLAALAALAEKRALPGALVDVASSSNPRAVAEAPSYRGLDWSFL